MPESQSHIEGEYNKAISIAQKITQEMSWINANYKILEYSSFNELSNKVVGTYAGHAWNTLRRTILNEIHSSISRILIDDDERAASLPRLHALLQDPNVVNKIKSAYTQAYGTFETRLQELVRQLDRLIQDINSDKSPAKSLIRHRNTRSAHAAIKPYSGPDQLKWGDEKHLIEQLDDIITPMELVLLNAGNISRSTRNIYERYAKDFWLSFNPKQP